MVTSHGVPTGQQPATRALPSVQQMRLSCWYTAPRETPPFLPTTATTPPWAHSKPRDPTTEAIRLQSVTVRHSRLPATPSSRQLRASMTTSVRQLLSAYLIDVVRSVPVPHAVAVQAVVLEHSVPVVAVGPVEHAAALPHAAHPLPDVHH